MKFVIINFGDFVGNSEKYFVCVWGRFNSVSSLGRNIIDSSGIIVMKCVISYKLIEELSFDN